jgi:hypothetical protein
MTLKWYKVKVSIPEQEISVQAEDQDEAKEIAFQIYMECPDTERPILKAKEHLAQQMDEEREMKADLRRKYGDE